MEKRPPVVHSREKVQILGFGAELWPTVMGAFVLGSGAKATPRLPRWAISRLLASLSLCGQEAEIAQVLSDNGVAAPKSSLLAKTGVGVAHCPTAFSALYVNVGSERRMCSWN